MNKKWTGRLICILVSLYMASIFTNMVAPITQIFVDTERAEKEGILSFYTYKQPREDVVPNENGLYEFRYEDNNRTFDIIVGLHKNKKINVCKVNNVDNSKCIPISEYTTSYLYANTYCIPIYIPELSRKFIYVLFFITWLMVFLLILEKEVFDQRGKYTHVFTFSSSAYKCLGKKPIILSFMVTIVSLVLYYGCDLTVISETIIMYEKGIDIYQLFAALNADKGATLLMWQYNGAMLAGYNLWSCIFYPFLKIFDPSQYHWIQAFEYKIFNMILCNLLILSIMSFFIDHRKLSKSKVKRVYYFSIFNPLTFYVAIWFIQFDILPAYCIMLAILLISDDMSNKKYLAAILLAFGIATKATMILFIPNIGVYCLLLFFKGTKKKKRELLSFSSVLIIMLGQMLLLPNILRTPISIAFSNLDQAKRVWYTTITYADNAVYLYISIFMLILCFVFGVYRYRLSLKSEDLVKNTIYVIGAITCAFSFSILPTPALYLLTTGAFVMLYIEAEDILQALMFACLGALIATSFMLAHEGDVTGSMLFFHKTPIFSALVDAQINWGESVKWASILHTVSAAMMFCFAVIFLKKANSAIDDTVTNLKY